MEMTDFEIVQSVMKLQVELTSALSEMKSLIAEMVAFQAVPKVEFASDEDEKAKVMLFLTNLRDSGIVNMLNADDYLQKRFGFTKAKSCNYLFDYIDSFSKVPVQVQPEPPKKKKGPKPYSEMTPEEVAEAKAKRSQAKPSMTNHLVQDEVVPKEEKRILKAKKSGGEAVKPKAVLIWNSFLSTVKAEMSSNGSIEVKYDDVRKKAQEMKEADPDSYRVFSENWVPETTVKVE
jgi:hypothetical protein